MAELDKVIKGLESCRKTDCINCPYSAVETEVCLIKYLLTDALELLKEQGNDIHHMGLIIEEYEKELKEQEAVEPTLIREGRNKNYNDYVCPRCDNEVVYEQNYCSECGVRFLWEEKKPTLVWPVPPERLRNKTTDT